MPTIAEAYVQIIPSAEGISGKISSALNNEAENAGSSSGGKFSSAFSNGLKKAGKGAVIAIGAATTGIAALTKASISGFAEMEQLMGGVDTLFTPTQSMDEFVTELGKIGVSAEEAAQRYTAGADIVKNNAAEAYKTAGISANEYMTQATSTAAAMVSSLGGDTVAAAKLADQAIIDMSDNANKMGTSIESIQNAYSGFAKGNFTMLDNLKLGYGGTKEEMERLLDDAEKLSGVEYDISSYADIAKAVHVIQENMNIAGTTAKEASTTISGSIQSMSAAWSNLVTGMADKNADVPGLINQFVESVGTVATNILPVVEQALIGVGTLIEQLVPEIMNRIPTFISETLPSLIESGISVIEAIITGIQENAEQLGNSAAEIISMLVVAISDMAPDLLNAALIIIEALASGLAENLDTIIPAVTSMILEIANVLVTHVDDIIAVGFQLFNSLVQGILQALPVIIQQLPVLINAITTTLIDSADIVLDGALQMFLAIVDAIPDIITALADALPAIIDEITSFLTGDGLPKILNGAITMLMAIVQAIPQIVSALAGALPSIISTLITFFVTQAPQIMKAGVELLGGLIKAIPQVIASLVSSIPQIITSIANALRNGIGQVTEVGRNLILGLWNGISDKFGWVLEKIKGLGKAILGKLSSVFEEKSPSKATERIGKYLGEGLGIGWEDSMKKVNAEIGKDLNYKGNIEVNSTFKDDFEEGLQVAANGLGASVPTTVNEDNSSLEGATIIINDSISLDGTPLKDIVAKYTIQKIGNEMRAMKVSKGGFNAI